MSEGKYYVAFVVLAILNFFDIWATREFLALGGEEANPLVAWIIAHYGIEGVAIFKSFILVLFGYFVYAWKFNPKALPSWCYTPRTKIKIPVDFLIGIAVFFYVGLTSIHIWGFWLANSI